MPASRFQIFTDGSSLKNPGGPGGTGYVVLDVVTSEVRHGARRYLSDGAYPVTNNRMELRAVLEALASVPDASEVLVFSDSQYLINALSKWIHGWRKRGWKTAQGTAVLNRDLLEAIDARGAALRLTYQWVRGHAGHPGNEMADALAHTAASGSPPPSRPEIAAAMAALSKAS